MDTQLLTNQAARLLLQEANLCLLSEIYVAQEQAGRLPVFTDT